MLCRPADLDGLRNENTTTPCVIALTLSAGTAPAQTLPQPKAGSPGGLCPVRLDNKWGVLCAEQTCIGRDTKALNGTCPRVSLDTPMREQAHPLPSPPILSDRVFGEPPRFIDLDRRLRCRL